MLRVLFVCTGNICRSPLAEAFLADRSHRLLQGLVQVHSAGTWAREGNHAMPESVAAGRERGVDLEAHRASPLRVAELEEADLVIGLTREHVAEITRTAPSVASKAFTLKEVAALLLALGPPKGPQQPDAARSRIADADALRRSREAPRILDLDVEDPMGLGLEVHRAIAWEIEGGVDGLVRGLLGVRPQPMPAAEEA